MFSVRTGAEHSTPIAGKVRRRRHRRHRPCVHRNRVYPAVGVQHLRAGPPHNCDSSNRRSHSPGQLYGKRREQAEIWQQKLCASRHYSFRLPTQIDPNQTDKLRVR